MATNTRHRQVLETHRPSMAVEQYIYNRLADGYCVPRPREVSASTFYRIHPIPEKTVCLFNSRPLDGDGARTMHWGFIVSLDVGGGLSVVFYMVYSTDGYQESERRDPWTRGERSLT
jgi:hypothetical protein